MRKVWSHLFLLSVMAFSSACALTKPTVASNHPPTVPVSSQKQDSTATPTITVSAPWKPFVQLEADLEAVATAGYSRVCVFDLEAIRDYPDPRYVLLLQEYANLGIEITIYVQKIKADQNTLDLVRAIGGSQIIVYEQELLELFRAAGIKTYWWSGVAFPYAHSEQPQYLDWPDLRSEQVRQALADWAVQIPPSIEDGLSLDYIRWNQVGDERTAEQVTDLLRKIRRNWKRVGKGSLSAAVYPYLGASPNHGGALSVGQKWNEWLRDGLVDWVYPMAYNSQYLAEYIEEWQEYEVARIVPCLSVMDYN